MASWEFVANANCGTGAGGFKRGNTCAKGKGGISGGRPGPKEDEKALRTALAKDVLDTTSRKVLADFLEENGNSKEATKLRSQAELIDRVVSLKSQRDDVQSSVSYMDDYLQHNRPRRGMEREYDRLRHSLMRTHNAFIREMEKLDKSMEATEFAQVLKTFNMDPQVFEVEVDDLHMD